MRTDPDIVTELVAVLKAFVAAAKVHNAGIVADTTCAVSFAEPIRQAESVLLEAEGPGRQS